MMVEEVNQSPFMSSTFSHSENQSPKLKQCQLLSTKVDQFALNDLQNIENNQSHSPLSNIHISLTEREIFSHKIILDLAEKSKKKTVNHQINKIGVNTRLYSIPKIHVSNQFNFESIPPNDKNFASTASSKLRQIHQRLSNQKRLSQRLKQNHKFPSETEQKKQKKCRESNPQTKSLFENKNKQVSMSGLVTYSFRSVNAKRSFGQIQKNQSEQIERKVQECINRNNRQIKRASKIISKRPNPTNLQNLQIAQASTCDFYTQTDKFLKVLKKESQKDIEIYGSRMEKLNCIKEFMQNQKTQYEQSKFIVEVIQNSRGSQKISPKKQKRINNTDDDVQLEKRKQVLKTKKILLKNLYFTE